MPILRVSLDFVRLPDPSVDAFAENVLTAMPMCSKYTTPSPPLAQVHAALALFTTALSAAAQGGKQATAAKDAARETLLGLMRQLASYVQVTANNDLPTLLASGFSAASTNRTQVPLYQPTILAITNGQPTKLTLQVTPLPNARAYEYQVRTGTGSWSPSVPTTRARGIVVSDLVPGTTYTFQVRGIGGSTGVSAWSPEMSHMAT